MAALLVVSAAVAGACSSEGGDLTALPDNFSIVDVGGDGFRAPAPDVKPGLPGPRDVSPRIDAGQIDAGPDCSVTPKPFGCPCTSNSDCIDPACVVSSEGRVCSRACVDDCPDGWSCRVLVVPGQDAVLVCLQGSANLCRPCSVDEECRSGTGEEEARCIRFGDTEGSFCGMPCTEGEDCPGGFVCEEHVRVEGSTPSKQCVPEDGRCACSKRSIEDAASTSCGVGSCVGERVCTAEGLSECSARAAGEEVCDGIDNDCDGLVDEALVRVCDNGCSHGQQICTDAEWGECSVDPEAEVCDGVDNDCDGEVDEEDSQGCSIRHLDADRDGFGLLADRKCLCADAPPYSTEVVGDCDDGDERVYPGAPEVCDGVDNDCDPETPAEPRGAPGCVKHYTDGDGDGFGHPLKSRCQCAPDEEYTSLEGSDCDDTDELAFPAAAERCNRVDDDCDGLTDEQAEAPGECPEDCGTDLECARTCNARVACSSECGAGEQLCVDGQLEACDAPPLNECLDATDGCTPFETCEACPELPEEVCNGVDDDCDGEVDEGVLAELYADADGDGYGRSDPLTDHSGCAGEEGFATLPGDCDETEPAVHPNAVESCNGVDDDCDGDSDEDFEELGAACDGPDSDKCANGLFECAEGGGGVVCGAESKVDIVERCTGLDDDCDGETDEDWPLVGKPCDGGDQDSCEDGTWRCTAGEDDVVCEDPEDLLVERCNGIDDDCDNETDEQWPTLGDLCDGEDADHCSRGQVVCTEDGSDTRCLETAEVTLERCNGVDDDCDSGVDEDWPDLGNTCDGADADLCRDGFVACRGDGSGAHCTDDDYSKSETCNGEDDDCDGQTDEAFTCRVGEDQKEGCGRCGERTRSCTGSCAWSAWGTCQNQGICSPGDEQSEGCGQCGTRKRACTDTCTWGPWSGCKDEGTCSPGVEDTEDCGNCGERSRICSPTCQWGSWGSCTGQGMCAVGAEQNEPCGNCGNRRRTCNGLCFWDSWGSCQDQGPCVPTSTKSCDNGWGTATCGSSCHYGDCECSIAIDVSGAPASAQQQPGRSDCDDGTWSLSAGQPISSASDVDWYRMGVNDRTGCWMDEVTVRLTSLPHNYELGVYYDCDNGSPELDCNSGTACTADGLSGCCSRNAGNADETVKIDKLECSATDDEGTMYIRVWSAGGAHSCEPYSLSWSGF